MQKQAIKPIPQYKTFNPNFHVYHTNDNLNLQLSNTVNEYTIDLDAVYQSKINSSFYRKTQQMEY